LRIAGCCPEKNTEPIMYHAKIVGYTEYKFKVYPNNPNKLGGCRIAVSKFEKVLYDPRKAIALLKEIYPDFQEHGYGNFCVKC